MAEERREDKAARPDGQGQGEGKPRGNRARKFRGPRRETATREAGSRESPGADEVPRGGPATDSTLRIGSQTAAAAPGGNQGQTQSGDRGRQRGAGLKNISGSHGGESQPQMQEVKRDSPVCPLCQKPIYDLANAVAEPNSGQPSHFDCILDRVSAAESIAPNEKIVYLGAGAFGVVEFKDKNENAFVVKRRIQWEKEGEKKDWRRSMSSGIMNL